MDKKIAAVLVTVFFMAGIVMDSFAMMCDMGSGSGHGEAHAETTEEGSAAVNAGNEVCPITGEAVDGKTTYEYKGKVYNFCCPMCIDEFKKDPAKYIEKVEKEVEAESAASHGMHEGHHH